MKRIIFNLKREWYDKIASGEKTVEYRYVGSYWAKRLGFDLSDVGGDEIGNLAEIRNPKTLLPTFVAPREWYAVFRLGYSRKHPDIVSRITKIDIGSCPYEGWDGEYFRIHFEPNAVRPSGLEGAGK